ncbi:MAG: hypothetical protein ACW99G_19060 [Candidatus Thorarchaeota archaeon]|jgi:hypothetical protein
MTDSDKANEDVKKYLASQPYDDSLPEGWQERFGRKGRFMQYTSLSHCERKNRLTSLEHGCWRDWDKIKSSFDASSDELWMYGNEGFGTAVLHIRENKIINTMPLAIWG